jgi:cell fate (sporulation/competence/biofilm development) regulator YlbF (YheA/YmcA/DUF963 family)
MPVDTDQILQEAEKLSQLVSQHPAVERYKAAIKAVDDDAEATRLMSDFNRQMETLERQAQAGMGITDAQRSQLEAIQTRIISHLKIKALNIAQVDMIDLLRRVSQIIQKPLGDSPVGGRGAGSR